MAALTARALTTLRAGLALKMVFLPGEGVDALAFLGGGLLDDDHADQAGNDEEAVLLQLGVADGGDGFEDAFDVLAGELAVGLVSDVLDQGGFGQGTFSHLHSSRFRDAARGRLPGQSTDSVVRCCHANDCRRTLQ